MQKILHSVEPSIQKELERILTTDAPKFIDAHNTKENLQKYIRYGNHSSAQDNPEEFYKVLVKDNKRGNTLIADDASFPFIPHTHLTPQGLPGVNNIDRKPRPVFDSTYMIDVLSWVINKLITCKTEPEVRFPGSFRRLLIWILVPPNNLPIPRHTPWQR